MHFYALKTLLHHYGDVVSIHLIRANDDEHALHRTIFCFHIGFIIASSERWTSFPSEQTRMLIESRYKFDKFTCRVYTKRGVYAVQEAARWSGEPFAFKTTQIVTSTPPHNYFHKKLLFHQNSRERIQKKKEKWTKFMTAETFQKFFSLFSSSDSI